jgi:hypothetical protein
MPVKTKLLSAAIGLAAIAGLATVAEAGPLTLKLTSGAVTQTITDNDADGVVLFIGSLGNFSVNVTTGLSGPALAGPYPHMDLNSVNLANPAGGTIQIALSQTGFTSPADVLPFLVTWGGTLSGLGSTASIDVFIDTDDALFSTNGTNVGDLGPFGAGAFSGSQSGVAPVDGSFSVSIFLNIALGQNGLYSGDTELQQVPVPGMLGLMGLALLGLGFAANRRRA